MSAMDGLAGDDKGQGRREATLWKGRVSITVSQPFCGFAVPGFEPAIRLHEGQPSPLARGVEGGRGRSLDSYGASLGVLALNGLDAERGDTAHATVGGGIRFD